MRKIQERHKDVTWKRYCTFLLLLMVMLLFLPKKTFAAEKESREADDPYTYHTAFDAKASLKIRHMKDYGVLDYEETVEVEDSCDYLDGDENLDEIQAKITAYDEKVQKACEGAEVVSGTDTRGIDADSRRLQFEDVEENGQMVTVRHYYQTYKIQTDWVLEKMEISDVNIVNSTLSCYAGESPKATAQKGDSNAYKYEIAYERWEKMEKDANGYLAPVAFWYSDESQYTAATPKFTTFEAGATYMYSAFLKTVNGNEFSKDLSLSLNGEPVNSQTVIVGNNGTTCFAVSLYSVRSEEKVTSDPIQGNNRVPNPPNPTDTSQTIFPKTGSMIKTKDALYKVTKADASGCTVTLIKPVSKNKTAFTVPAAIKSEDGNITFQVTEISKNAFKNNVKLKKVTIGKNVSKIGAGAFSGCKKLKNIKITSTQLTKKSVGKNAFKGIDKKAVIKVPKKKLKAYKNILKGKGQAKSVKIKK